MNREITEKAYAKINIGLDITGRREDGYHLLDTVMHTIDLCDTITIRRNDSGEINVTTDGEGVILGEKNLMRRAAVLLLKDAGVSCGLDIIHHSRIPVRSGMGGGSADAAAVLRGVNALLELGYSAYRLRGLAVSLGADVPFLISGGTARCTGIGEVIEELPGIDGAWILAAKPAEGIDTAHVFAEIDKLVIPQSEHPNMDETVAYIHTGEIDHVAECMGNILERVTAAAVPEVKRYKQIMMRGGALGALMTGSGTTVFGIFDDRSRAEACAEELKDAAVTVISGM